MNYSVHQIVKVAPWLVTSPSLYEFTVCDEMSDLAGEKAEIAEVWPIDHYYRLMGNEFYWTEDMLVPANAFTFEDGACPICGAKENLVDVLMHTGEIVHMCKKHADLYTITCDDCGMRCIRSNTSVARFWDDDDTNRSFCLTCLSTKSVCPVCGDIMVDPVNLDGTTMCSSCASITGKKCAACGEFHLPIKMECVEGDYYCAKCVANLEYILCEGCGKKMIKKAGVSLCNTCKPYYTRVNGYHHGPELYFRGNDKKMMGLELEVDDGCEEDRESDATEVCKIMNYHVYCCNDGSLNTGFEIITHPHTYQGLMDLPWENMCKYLVHNDWRGHDTSTAGLHIHISRTAFKDEDAITRFMLFFENNWSFAKMFSRRGTPKLRTWAAPYLASTDNDVVEPTKFTKDDVDKRKYNGDRRHCVNLTNKNTIEVRIFRSSLNPNTIRASIELVNLLVDQANRLSDKEAETFTPAQWLEGASENLLTYCASRKIPLNEEEEA